MALALAHSLPLPAALDHTAHDGSRSMQAGGLAKCATPPPPPPACPAAYPRRSRPPADMKLLAALALALLAAQLGVEASGRDKAKAPTYSKYSLAQRSFLPVSAAPLLPRCRPAATPAAARLQMLTLPRRSAVLVAQVKVDSMHAFYRIPIRVREAAAPAHRAAQPHRGSCRPQMHAFLHPSPS